jgi:hypothetical protein
MNSNKFLKLKLIVIKLKREFPNINIQYQQPNFLGPELCAPNNIYITQNADELFATFTNVNYRNLSITRSWTDSRFHENRVLIYQSYLNHDFEKIKISIIDKCPEFYLKNRLLKSHNPNSDKDIIDYGEDIINLIDRISLECMHFSLGRKPLNLISTQDIVDYGGDFIGMIKTIVMNVIFEMIWRISNQDETSTEVNITLIDKDQLEKLNADYGSDLIEMVYKYAKRMYGNLNSTDFSESEMIYQLLYEKYPILN